MDLTVIICTWNRAESLRKALATLQASIVPANIEWEVLVVDNNSTDSTKAVCGSFIQIEPRRFRYLFEGKQGKTNALNAAFKQAAGHIFALTDDDVTVDPHWIANIYYTIQKFNCAAVGGRIIPIWNCPKPAWITFEGPYRHPAYGGIVNFDKGNSACELTATAVGANMALRKSSVEKYGPYRTDLNRINDLLGGEDTEYCRRLMHAGEKLIYAPDAVVYHPVEKFRTTRKYMQSFAFHYGRWMVRVEGVPGRIRCWFGVPRYLFPIALECLAKWIFSIGRQKRAFYRLELFSTFGKMMESKSWLAASHAQASLGGLDPAK
jgi:glucosyl-dolichyl phosphate glucuronosyltransferase